MERGSEWRKWDLHVHTPGTAKNDKFGNSEDIWEKYIDSLEKSDVAVFGITDYFSIQNYCKVKEMQNNGRLQGKLILPNVEMRIHPVTGKGAQINIHAIFDPALDKSSLEREFFRQLQFSYKDASYSCIESDLIQLGRVVSNNDNLPDDDAVKCGINVFTVSPNELKKVVEKDFFKGHIIIALSNSSNDGASGILRQDGSLQPLREEITRMADIILSGNPSDVEYFCGERTSIDEVIATYGSLKPCVIGSDAHDIASVGAFPNDRITWIKADPTFEGLKQILFEPKERVRISETKPDIKYDFNVIDYVQVNTANVWNQTIKFNQNLTTIIGGRSTGKSTLLSSIATKLKINKKIDSNGFIKSLTENVHVVWRDGQEHDDVEIEYFTQNEIANIIDKGNPNSIFLDIFKCDTQKRDAYQTFLSDEAQKYSSIQSKVTLFFEKKRKYAEKTAYIKTLGDKDSIVRELEKLEKERTSIQLKLTDKKETLDKFQAIEKELNNLKTNKLKLESELETLGKLIDSDFVIINPAISLSGLTEEHKELISEELKRVISQSNLQLHTFINNCNSKTKEQIQDLDKRILEIQNDESYMEGKRIFDANKNLTLLTEQVKTLLGKKNEIEKERKIWDELEKEYKEVAADLLREHLFYLEMMNSIASIMNVQRDNIRLFASYELKQGLEKFLTESLSLRSFSTNELISNVTSHYAKKSKEDIKTCLRDLLNMALKEKLPFKNGYNAKTFISNVLSNNWFKLKFNVDYENDKLNDMSPGKRSFVILKLILDISNKTCPILIDQPEDNLDNRAIYNELVKYIREKKKERQIILVTHNPNIVVGADSEEVIVANQNGKNAPNDGAIQFQYVSGSLENSSPRITDNKVPMLKRCGIREHVCDILEGGENAFKDRENKYGFFKI